MLSSIKITSLIDIGSNIAYTSVLPLVNMAGTPTTQKANLQNLGNLILNGAGGANLARAAQSTLALSVANAAQPNITSVGTLTSLNVVSVSTTHIPGGNVGDLLTTDGAGNLSWAAPVGQPGGTTSQIQFNVSGHLAGSANLTWDNANSILKTTTHVTTPVPFANLTSTVTGSRAFVTDGNLVAVGNFGQQVSGGGANAVPVFYDGIIWRIG